MDIQVDTSQIPVIMNENGDQVLRFFWLDAYEDQYKNPGIVEFKFKMKLEVDRKIISLGC